MSSCCVCAAVGPPRTLDAIKDEIIVRHNWEEATCSSWRPRVNNYPSPTWRAKCYCKGECHKFWLHGNISHCIKLHIPCSIICRKTYHMIHNLNFEFLYLLFYVDQCFFGDEINIFINLIYLIFEMN